jgi:hypothetical protein
MARKHYPLCIAMTALPYKSFSLTGNLLSGMTIEDYNMLVRRNMHALLTN